MRAFTTIAAALLVAGAQAAPAAESRQIIYGCYFNGDGLSNQLVTVGHDTDLPGRTKTWHVTCDTTSDPAVPDSGVYAKCTVDGKKPEGITVAFDKNNINCPIA